MDFIIQKSESGLWRNIKAYKQHLNDLPPGRYKIIVENEDKRSGQQNKWIHSILPEIRMALRDIGWDDIKTNEDAKDYIRNKFFWKEISNGEDVERVVIGTSKTSKLDFTSKAEDIIKWAAEYLGIDIAPPDHQLTVFDKENYEYERGNE